MKTSANFIYYHFYFCPAKSFVLTTSFQQAPANENWDQNQEQQQNQDQQGWDQNQNQEGWDQNQDQQGWDQNQDQQGWDQNQQQQGWDQNQQQQGWDQNYQQNADLRGSQVWIKMHNFIMLPFKFNLAFLGTYLELSISFKDLIFILPTLLCYSYSTIKTQNFPLCSDFFAQQTLLARNCILYLRELQSRQGMFQRAL